MARSVRLGVRDVVFPSSELRPIESCEELLAVDDDGASLRARFAKDGFVYLRGVLGPAAVMGARDHVMKALESRGGIFDNNTGLLLPECGLGCVPNLEGRNGTTHAPEMLAVIDGAPLRSVMAKLLKTTPNEIRSFDYKWLRAVPRALFTGVHVDAVYMSRGSPSLLTAWVPLERSATLELGALALARGSHASPGLARVRATYGAFDTESEPGFQGSGWLTSDPADIAAIDPSVSWVSGDYSAGDVVIFGMHMLHMSTANCTDALRLSVDVRFQPLADPIDERYTGSLAEMEAKQRERKKGGAWAVSSGESGAEAVPQPAVTMDALRQRWGI